MKLKIETGSDKKKETHVFIYYVLAFNCCQLLNK